MKKQLPGFALLEAAMALMILGIIASFTFPMITTLMKYERDKRTANHREQILRALAGYLVFSGKGGLPCPMGPGGRPQDVCKGTQCIGIIPYDKLGISKKMAKDGYGHWFTYVVHGKTTENKMFEQRKIPIGNVRGDEALDFFLEAEGNIINLKDFSTNAVISEADENPIILLLISHGPDGAGAFNEDASEKLSAINIHEKINAEENMEFVMGEGNGFSHQVTWVTKIQFAACYAHNLLPLIPKKYNLNPDYNYGKNVDQNNRSMSGTNNNGAGMNNNGGGDTKTDRETKMEIAKKLKREQLKKENK